MLPNLVVAMRSLTVLGSISLFERVYTLQTPLETCNIGERQIRQVYLQRIQTN